LHTHLLTTIHTCACAAHCCTGKQALLCITGAPVGQWTLRFGPQAQGTCASRAADLYSLTNTTQPTRCVLLCPLTALRMPHHTTTPSPATEHSTAPHGPCGRTLQYTMKRCEVMFQSSRGPLTLIGSMPNRLPGVASTWCGVGQAGACTPHHGSHTSMLPAPWLLLAGPSSPATSCCLLCAPYLKAPRLAHAWMHARAL
jgi:hypothetical protein